ncbi:methyl-accepting chemotaxis protein [Magnetococcus sp. PR-3]|uniref:methyl-accepting chemotaxis protein n=1 Tax=Magnetococcus sp. PR-3 TaxID=3120355 RepID=UPI002FCE62FB
MIQTIRGRISLTLIAIVGGGAVVLSLMLGWFILYENMMEDTKAKAMTLLQRSGQMFMVSTKKFHTQYNEAASEEEKDQVRDDWMRTIFAVDDAVTSDFGKETIRVRLIGDADIFPLAPYGGDNTKIEIPFEKEAAIALKDGKQGAFEQIDDTHYRISVPLHTKMHDGCAECHLQDPKDPKQVMGTLNAYVPLSGPIAQVQAVTSQAVIMVLLLCLIIGLTVYWSVSRLLKRVEVIKDGLQTLAQGDKPDLTQELPVGRRDEIGELVEGFNQFVQVIRSIVTQVQQGSHQLVDATRAVHTLSGDMRTDAGHMQGHAQDATSSAVQMNDAVASLHSVTGEVERYLTISHDSTQHMSANMSTIASAAEEASTNLGTVATVSNEVNTGMETVRDIAQRTHGSVNHVAQSVLELKSAQDQVRSRCQEASQESQQANEGADATMNEVEKLSSMAAEIVKVVEIINNIAEQTNMLALNAAIESAGAGEAGKGFAVVANEVKELASQTADATGMISDKVEQIRNSTHRAHKQSEKVRDQIRRISTYNMEINSSVDEQNLTLEGVAQAIDQVAQETANVADLVSNASGNIGDMSRNVSEISYGIDEVTQNVSEASNNTGEVTQNMNHATEQSTQAREHFEAVTEGAQVIHKLLENLTQQASMVRGRSDGLDESMQKISKVGVGLEQLMDRFKV